MVRCIARHFVKTAHLAEILARLWGDRHERDAVAYRGFPEAAKALLQDSQTRKNVQHATNVIQGKRNKWLTNADWKICASRSAGTAHTLRHLDHYLTQFEEN